MSAVIAGAFSARLHKQLLPEPDRREEVRAEAARMASDAQGEAARIVENARAEAARIVAEAEDEARRKADVTVSETLLASRKALADEMAAMRPVLAALIRDAVGRLVGEIPEEERLGRLVVRALDDLADGARATLGVHPDEVEPVTAHLAGRAVPETAPVVVADASVPRGQARLRAAGISAELGLERQLRLLEDLLVDR